MSEKIYTTREILENLRARINEQGFNPTLLAQVESLKELSPNEAAEFLFLMLHSWADSFRNELQSVRKLAQETDGDREYQKPSLN